MTSRRSSASAWRRPASATPPPALDSSARPQPRGNRHSSDDGSTQASWTDTTPSVASRTGRRRVTNVLRHAGVDVGRHAARRLPRSTVNGLCGGPGFLYAVFVYKGWPPLLSIALQSRSMPDAYIGGGLARLGVKTTKSETTSAGAARKVLDATLGAGKPALCPLACGPSPSSAATATTIGSTAVHQCRLDCRPRGWRVFAADTRRRRTAWSASTDPNPSADAVSTLRHAIAETAAVVRRATCAEVVSGELWICGPREVAAHADRPEGQERRGRRSSPKGRGPSPAQTHVRVGRLLRQRRAPDGRSMRSFSMTRRGFSPNRPLGPPRVPFVTRVNAGPISPVSSRQSMTPR